MVIGRPPAAPLRAGGNAFTVAPPSPDPPVAPCRFPSGWLSKVKGGGGMTAQEFHDLKNLTQARIWRCVVACARARERLAEARQSRERARQVRELAQSVRHPHPKAA